MARPRAARLFGRDRELASVRAALDRDEIVALTGPAGVGKTELALHVAATSERAAIVVDLSCTREEDEALAKIAAACGVARSEPDVLRHALSVRDDLLLVLDGVDAVPSVVDALPSTLPALLTLRAGPERVHDVAVRPLAEADAAALFVERASRVARMEGENGAFATRADRLLLARIVDRLDGLPFAIELAAACADRLSLVAILDQLRLEREESRPFPLQSAIELAFDALDDEARAVLAQCAVFEGGFGVEAVEAVVLPSPALSLVTSRPRASRGLLDVVAWLSSRALVRVEEVGASTRFSLAGPVRHAALESLDDATRKRLLRRHAEHYASHAKVCAAADRENLLAAHATALVDPDLPPGIAAALALAIAREMSPWSGVTARLEATLARVRSLPLLLALADQQEKSGALDVRLVDEAAAAAERTPGGVWTAHVALLRARAALRPPSDAPSPTSHAAALHAAAAECEAALATVATLDSPTLAGELFSTLAALRRRQGRLDDALSLLERARIAHHHGGAPCPETIATLGHLRRERGDVEGARAAFAEAIACAVDGGGEELAATASARRGLGELAADAGDLDAARAQLDVAARLAAAAGAGVEEGRVELARAACAFEAGALSAARAHAHQALLFLGDDAGDAYALLAVVAAATDARDDATRLLAESRLDIETMAAHRGHLALAAAREARARGDDDRARACEDEARERLEAAPHGTARRLLARALASLDGTTAEGALIVRGAELRFPDGRAAIFDRKPTLRRLVEALVRHRLDAPGRPLAIEALLAAGWPGERVPPKVGKDRLHTSIAALKELGLRGLLLSRADGWLLDPDVPLHIVAATSSV